MTSRSLALAGVLALVVALTLVSATAAGQAAAKVSKAAQKPNWNPPRTSYGQPDLQGVWDYRTVTPLERPRTLTDKKVLTNEEAAAFEEEINRSENRDLVDPKKGGAGYAAEAQGGVVPYNEFWYDRGNKISADKRTSLIVDPPDGRIPWTREGLKQVAQEAAEGRES